MLCDKKIQVNNYYKMECFCLKQKYHVALACEAQWTECQPVKQSVSSSIPNPGTCLEPGPR